MILHRIFVNIYIFFTHQISDHMSRRTLYHLLKRQTRLSSVNQHPPALSFYPGCFGNSTCSQRSQVSPVQDAIMSKGLPFYPSLTALYGNDPISNVLMCSPDPVH